MKRIVTFGEIMLRLKSPGHERLFQSPALEATFGGGEANVAVSLALLGMEAAFVTALPANQVGDAAIRSLRSFGVDTSLVARPDHGRVGIYFLETGADQRASLVVYDRADSAISRVGPDDFDWDSIFARADWFHFTGITPALSHGAAEACIAAAKAARSRGVMVSLDLNYRKKLWNYGVSPPLMMRRIVPDVDLLVANEEDIQLALGISAEGADPGAGEVDPSVYRTLASKVMEAFPNLSGVAVTLRRSRSADRNGWSAVFLGREGFHVSRAYDMEDIVDRVGGGDSFAAGLVFGLLEYRDEAKALEFAVAASALKHTIPGDCNLVTRAEVERLMAGDRSGRVSR